MEEEETKCLGFDECLEFDEERLSGDLKWDAAFCSVHMSPNNLTQDDHVQSASQMYEQNTRGDGLADRDKESRPEDWVALLACGGVAARA